MEEDFNCDALTIRAPQRTRWYTRLWSACRGCGCLCLKKQRFPLYLIGYDPVGRFQRAAGVGNVALVERLINASEHHVDECDRRGRSSLHYASAHNHPNVVTLLSSNDCTNINIKDDEGCTPLIKAAQRDNVECISILLMHGADPNIIDDSGYAALHYAICRGNIRVVRKLLEYNVDIKAKTEYGLTPYKLALFENQVKMAQFLIDNGANAPSELTPNSGGAAAVESEQSMKTCANFNKEGNFSTDIKPSCSAVRPARQLKSLLKKSFLIKRASRRLKDPISLSEETMTRELEQRKKKRVTFNKEVHYNTNKKPFCSGIRPPGELKPILKKSPQISGGNGRNQDQISLGTSSTILRRYGESGQSERDDNLKSSVETTVNTTSVSERGDNRQSSEETTVNNTSVDHTPSLGDALDPQNAHMWVLASSPTDGTFYVSNTSINIFSIWATTTLLLLLTSSKWLVLYRWL